MEVRHYMTSATQTILKEALRLKPVERAELIDELFHSFDKSHDERIDALWAAESESRIDAFAAEVNNTFDRIKSFSDAWPLISSRSRRCIINRFPYGVLYQAMQDFILVTAIMHLRRDPKKWQERIKTFS